MNDAFIAVNHSTNSVNFLDSIEKAYTYAEYNNIDDVVIFFPKLGSTADILLKCLGVYMQDYSHYCGRIYMILEQSDMLKLSVSDFAEFSNFKFSLHVKGDRFILENGICLQCDRLDDDKYFMRNSDEFIMRLGEEEKQGSNTLHIFATDNNSVREVLGKYSNRVCFVESSTPEDMFRVFNCNLSDGEIVSYTLNSKLNKGQNVIEIKLFDKNKTSSPIKKLYK